VVDDVVDDVLAEVGRQVSGVGVGEHPFGVVAASEEHDVVGTGVLGEFSDLALSPDVAGDLVDLDRDAGLGGEGSRLGCERVGLWAFDGEDTDLARRRGTAGGR